MIKAVFFDLDETLVGSMKASREATILAFKYFGFEYKKIKEKTKDVSSMGKRVQDALKYRRDGAGITEEQIPLRKLLEIRKKYFFELAEKYAGLYPGVISTFKKLKAKKIFIIIVSSSTKEYINLCIKKFNLTTYIDFIVSGDQVSKGKPDPECYEKAYKYLNNNYGKINKEECLVIEDTENGVISAFKAGLKILLVPSKYSVIPRSIKVDYQIKSLEEFDNEILSI